MYCLSSCWMVMRRLPQWRSFLLGQRGSHLSAPEACLLLNRCKVMPSQVERGHFLLPNEMSHLRALKAVRARLTDNSFGCRLCFFSWPLEQLNCTNFVMVEGLIRVSVDLVITELWTYIDSTSYVKITGKERPAGQTFPVTKYKKTKFLLAFWIRYFNNIRYQKESIS